MDLSDLPEDQLERLAAYRAARRRSEARAAEEERKRVEDIDRRRLAGETLSEAEWAAWSYSPFGSAAGCRCR